MRVLFLTHLVPYPPDTGAKIRAYYVLKHLSRAGHEIVLCAFSRPEDSPDPAEELRSLCAEIHTLPIRRSWRRNVVSAMRSGLKATSFLMDRDWAREMQSLVGSCLGRGRRFDVLHADQLVMAPYAVEGRDLCRTYDRPGLVLDQHNAVFRVFQRLASSETRFLRRTLTRWEATRLANQEGALCRGFDHVVWVAEHDRRAMEKLLQSMRRPLEVPSTVIPIGVDPVAQPEVPRADNPHRVLFIGPLNWPPNLQGVLRFLRRTWPRIHAQVPSASFTVIGRRPPRWLVREGRRRRDLDVPGHVTDLAPYLRETATLVAPLEAGGGLRVKILDAWCWGIPVVSTSLGAEGLATRDQQDLILADDEGAFAAAVVRLLQDSAAGKELARRGRNAVENGYDWRKVYPAWDQVYANLAAEREGMK